MHKEKRQQTEEREWLSDEIRQKIQYKSDDRCVWCGKKVFLGYEGTVDHFIPLKKGGTNDEVNLVLMCHDCNQKKGSRIFPTNVAASYLKDKYRTKLNDYFEEFVQKYDYVSRGNLMSSDVYEMFFLPPALEEAEAKAKRKGKQFKYKPQRSKYLLKRAYPDDQEKLVQYYIKYLTKYKKLSSPEAALENIKFWMRFGVIYFIEKNNEITAMSCVTVNVHGYISFDIFVYYSTTLAWTMAKGIVDCLGGAILAENDLPYLPLSFNLLVKDELTKYYVPEEIKTFSDGTMSCTTSFIRNTENYKDPRSSEEAKEHYKEGVAKFAQFIDRFDDNIEDDVLMYLYQNDLMSYSWMGDEILGRSFFGEEFYKEPDKVFDD